MRDLFRTTSTRFSRTFHSVLLTAVPRYTKKFGENRVRCANSMLSGKINATPLSSFFDQAIWVVGLRQQCIATQKYVLNAVLMLLIRQSMLVRHQHCNGFPIADQVHAVLINHDFGGARSRVVVGGHAHAICAGGCNRNQIPRNYR